MRKSNFSVLMNLLSMLKPLSGVMLICITLGIIGFFCAIAITILGVHILLFNLGVSPFELSIQSAIIWMIVCAVFRAALRYGEQMSGHYIAFKLLAIIRDKVFCAMRRLAPAKLETRNRGDLISMITSDIELLEVFYAHTIAPVVIAVVVSITMVVITWEIHWSFGIVSLIAYILVGYVIPTWTAKIGKKQAAEYRSVLGALNSYFLESIRGIRESVQFGATDSRHRSIEEQTESINGLHRRMSLHEGTTSAISAAAVMLFPIVMIVLGYMNGIGSGKTIMAAVILASSFGPVFALSNLSSVLTKTLASARRVLSLLDEDEETKDVVQGETPEYHDLVVKNLSFAYDGEEVLSNISMDFDKKSVVAITGSSGSGKTTLLKLIMRFWNSPKGAVKMSGVDIGDIKTSHLREVESYMTQDTDLFQDTIEANIKIAKMDATHEEVVEAAKKASVHDFIMGLPKGYKTKVGELGDTLSGGEKQRIGLARVFLHDAPLVLLDEPTSNLDSLNEAVILKALKNSTKDRATILVSHRKSALAIADKVYNIEKVRES